MPPSAPSGRCTTCATAQPPGWCATPADVDRRAVGLGPRPPDHHPDLPEPHQGGGRGGGARPPRPAGPPARRATTAPRARLRPAGAARAVRQARVTASAKHVARKPLAVAVSTDGQARARNKLLRARFLPRPVERWWRHTAQPPQATLQRLTAPPFVPAVKATRAGRRRGVAKLLGWLSSFPGDTWQQRWLASGAEDHPGAGWVQLPLGWLGDRGQAASYDPEDLASGLLMLVCGDVLRPGLPWMLTRSHRYLAGVMAQTRDPDGFARLRRLAAAEPASSRLDARVAATRIATLLACKGGTISEITVGDCVELVDAQRRVHVRGGQKKVDFYLRLRALGIFPADAPPTIRAFGLALGRLSLEELVDRYRLQCRPVRDLLVDYLRERQASLDFASVDAISRSLAGMFWARIEALAPGIDSLRLPPEVARAWKQQLQTKTRTTTNAAGEAVEIAPSKTDTERLLLVSPELADILNAIVSRLRRSSGAIPLVASYDVREKVWNPPMPLLFQRAIGTERRAFTPSAIRKLLINALAATGLTDTDGEPLVFSPHDFRRIFVTDAIMNGLPPHMAQVIC